MKLGEELDFHTTIHYLGHTFEAGYRVEWITPYDLFPRTYHVETLALLGGGG